MIRRPGPHYTNDSNGQFVGRITHVTEGSHHDIWFVGERGLFHLSPQTGQITRPPATGNDLSADYVYEDKVGNLWMLAYSPIVGLIKYDRQYPVGPRAVGLVSSKLFADGQKGCWVLSSLGLYYFDRRTGHLTLRFQHVDSNPDGLNDNAVVSIYKDKGGVLWVRTENGGLIFSISTKNSSVVIRTAPAIRIVSRLAGSLRFTEIPRVFCG